MEIGANIDRWVLRLGRALSGTATGVFQCVGECAAFRKGGCADRLLRVYQTDSIDREGWFDEAWQLTKPATKARPA